jgi:hypothetical protein
MGYDLHITRAEHWAESEQNPITAEERLAFIESDRELTIDPRGNGPYFALWLAHQQGVEHPWFDWFRGEIHSKYPDRKCLGKMLKITEHFDAKVQEDEGEVNNGPENLPEC